MFFPDHLQNGKGLIWIFMAYYKSAFLDLISRARVKFLRLIFPMMCTQGTVCCILCLLISSFDVDILGFII